MPFKIILYYAFGLSLTDRLKIPILIQLGGCFTFFALLFKDYKVTFNKIHGLDFGDMMAMTIKDRKLEFYIGDVLIIAISFCISF